MTVDTVRAEFLVEDGELRVVESTLSKQRKNISVYNTVETLSKHPSIFINYLGVLAGLKGIKFQIQAVPEEQKGQPKKKKKTKKNAKIEQMLTAKGFTCEEFEKLSFKKRVGKTTTQENWQVDKLYWQDFFETTELKEEILQNFVYDQTPSRTSSH